MPPPEMPPQETNTKCNVLAVLLRRNAQEEAVGDEKQLGLIRGRGQTAPDGVTVSSCALEALPENPSGQGTAP